MSANAERKPRQQRTTGPRWCRNVAGTTRLESVIYRWQGGANPLSWILAVRQVGSGVGFARGYRDDFDRSRSSPAARAEAEQISPGRRDLVEALDRSCARPSAQTRAGRRRCCLAACGSDRATASSSDASRRNTRAAAATSAADAEASTFL